MDDDIDYLIEHPDPVPFTDWRKVAIHALYDLRVLGVDIEQIEGVTPQALSEVSHYARQQTSYT